jgi:hypothetical protein
MLGFELELYSLNEYCMVYCQKEGEEEKGVTIEDACQ